MQVDLKKVAEELEKIITNLLDEHPQKKGSIFVIGCSSSEVCGGKIGKDSSEEVGKVIFSVAEKILSERGIFLACQCCEHLNRALVVEREAMERYGLEQVNAIPQPNHAGGAFATVCYQRFKDPVLVESIMSKADAGIDIGGTMIGMHMHSVVVPMRISLRKIGQAPIICARHRPKYVGGQRAIYDENLM